MAPNQLSWPVTTGYVSSGYKWRRLGGTTSFHGAIDIAANRGTPIKAAAGGVVICSILWSGRKYIIAMVVAATLYFSWIEF